MDFRGAVDEFLRFCAVERRLSRHSLEAYSYDLADFQKWLPQGMRLSDTSSLALKGYLHDMVEIRKLSAATVRRRLACLRAFFRWLAELGQVPDPFTTWRVRLPRRKRLPRTLSRSEISILLSRFGKLHPQEPEHDGFSVAVRLMVVTGARVGELCKLRINDISPDGSALRIQGKGSRERMAYVADSELRKQLKHYLEWRLRRNDVTSPLLVSQYGAPMRPQSIRSRLRRHAEQAGLTRRVTPHMLRHTAATLLIESGVDIRFVQRLLGHSSIATTEIYTHVSDEALRTTLERADVLGMLAQR